MALALLPRLTPRELRLLGLIASGYTNAQIAEAPSLTCHTVDNYVSGVLEKFEVDSRTRLLAKLRHLERQSHRRFTA